MNSQVDCKLGSWTDDTTYKFPTASWKHSFCYRAINEDEVLMDFEAQAVKVICAMKNKSYTDQKSDKRRC